MAWARQAAGVGGTAVGRGAMLWGPAAAVGRRVGPPEVGSMGSGARPAGAAGIEAAALVREEAGAERLSEAGVWSGAGAVPVAGADMEAGAETVETGGGREEEDRGGPGGEEAVPVKDSDLWDPSPSLSGSAACRTRISPVGGGVEAPWLDWESR